MPNGYGNYGGCSALSPVANNVDKSSGYGGCSRGWDGLIPLFILVGLLALFIPGGFFFILLLILLLILVCACGVCDRKY